ncbi:hypothetical protein RND71_035347 [Anisodus tanguticus]|uniref:Uncharacterized protein n=1 Tax=Anisodus tanguticus TaxID=243964 RepID=A0AAE1R5C9_9SOLA|nr:hypothetical protein RND71_035347 [Anisodus tanguticus]
MAMEYDLENYGSIQSGLIQLVVDACLTNGGIALETRQRSIMGFAKGTPRGVAPHARLVVYEVTWTGGSYTSDYLVVADMESQSSVDSSRERNGISLPNCKTDWLNKDESRPYLSRSLVWKASRSMDQMYVGDDTLIQDKDLNNNNKYENLNNHDQEIDLASGQPRARDENGTSPHVPRCTRKDPTPNDEYNDAKNGIRITRSDLTKIF